MCFPRVRGVPLFILQLPTADRYFPAYAGCPDEKSVRHKVQRAFPACGVSLLYGVRQMLVYHVSRMTGVSLLPSASQR